MTREELDILIGDHREELKNRLHWVIGNYFGEIINSVSAERLIFLTEDKSITENIL